MTSYYYLITSNSHFAFKYKLSSVRRNIPGIQLPTLFLSISASFGIVASSEAVIEDTSDAQVAFLNG